MAFSFTDFPLAVSSKVSCQPVKTQVTNCSRDYATLTALLLFEMYFIFFIK